ncbi:MAG TPA: methyltransferase domain-containing protein [Solirubrobacteraceae bacterium]
MKLLSPSRAADGSALLNVGAGVHASAEWTNIDLADAPHVIRHDIRRGLPFARETFDAVYASHVLEHLSPDDGDALVAEMRRVLKRGGVLRLAVPDLERTVRAYLERLEAARDADDPRYRWIKLELLDQLVRDRSGGLMVRALREGAVDPQDVRERIGDELLDAVDALDAAPAPAPGAVASGLRAKVLATGPGQRLRTFLLDRADPRKLGEVHRWMYDRVDLVALLRSHGFADAAPTTHAVSRISHWERYRLDSTPDGARPRKPDSLFVEATLR